MSRSGATGAIVCGWRFVRSGRPAVTHYRVLERFRAHTYLSVKLETGRTHQIRLHLSHIKYPIVGDPVYGGRFGLPRGRDPGSHRHLAHIQATGPARRRSGIRAPAHGQNAQLAQSRAGGLCAAARGTRRGCTRRGLSGGARPVSASWALPDWPVPGGVRALSTFRTGGVKYGSLRLAQPGGPCRGPRRSGGREPSKPEGGGRVADRARVAGAGAWGTCGRPRCGLGTRRRWAGGARRRCLYAPAGAYMRHSHCGLPAGATGLGFRGSGRGAARGLARFGRRGDRGGGGGLDSGGRHICRGDSWLGWVPPSDLSTSRSERRFARRCSPLIRARRPPLSPIPKAGSWRILARSHADASIPLESTGSTAAASARLPPRIDTSLIGATE